ncbi:MAG TPA: universal stress protein [Kofleriaceae bacterium]|jgi:nucleotide-binding universal stress UspA family protein|nr:universal stress protein [Kofleriaceae bacterium]
MTTLKKIHVVVGYDFSGTAEEALARALDVACRAPQHTLHILAALDPRQGLAVSPTVAVDYEYAEQIQRLAGERITAALAGRASMHEVQFFVYARIGSASEEILRLAEEVGADMIFVGSHSRTGIRRVLLGSVSEHVVREAKCPVMVVKPKDYAEVELEQIVESPEPHHRYARPHRYSYVDQRVITRPANWPL